MTTSGRAWISLCQITTCENWGVQAIFTHKRQHMSNPKPSHQTWRKAFRTLMSRLAHKSSSECFFWKSDCGSAKTQNTEREGAGAAGLPPEPEMRNEGLLRKSSWWAPVLRSRISLSLYLVLRPLFIDATTKSLWVIRWKRTTLNESDVFLFFIHFWARIRSPSFLPLAKTLAVALVIPTCDLKVGSTVLIRQETITKDP